MGEREEVLRGSASLQIMPSSRPKSIVVANSKGGCGKTTLATNLAAFFANSGKATALVDYDPQASSSHWLKLRPESAAPIVGIAAYSQPGAQETRSFHIRLPRDIQRVVIDTPAALTGTLLYHQISAADLIVIPIVPSPFDIHATENFIHELQMSGVLKEESKQILVVANRVRQNTVMCKRLSDYLQNLGLPRVTYIRDSQLYTHTAERGLGASDLSNGQAASERNHWTRIGSWIENRFAIHQSRWEAELAKSADQLARY